MQLLHHNEITLTQVEEFLSNGENCCVVNPCGSGKTSIMAALLSRHPDKSFLVITKQKNARQYYQSRDVVFSRENVKIVTFNKMLRDVNARAIDEYKKDIYLIDEAHYLGAPQWKIAFAVLTNMFHPLLVGLTATPQRYADRGTDKTIVTAFFNGNSAGNYTTKQLEAANVFVEPEYVLSIYNFAQLAEKQRNLIITSDLEEDRQKALLTKLDNALSRWKNNDSPQNILKNYLPRFLYKEKCNRILVYVANSKEILDRRAEMDMWIRDVFPDKCVRSYRYTYRDPESVLHDFQQEDSVDIKILYAIDKIMETVHIDDMRIVIMLRPSVSDRIITQQFGRINSISNKNKPLIIDMVDNLSQLKRNSKDGPKNASSTHVKNEQMKTVQWKLPHTSYYSNIFQDIDNSLNRVKRYTYCGFSGSLRDVCNVFCVNYEDVSKLLKNHLGFDMAMKIAEASKVHITQKIFDDVPESASDIASVELTPAQKAYAEDNISLVSDFIERRNIQDEDLQQELYINYCASVVKTENQTVDYMRKARIAKELRDVYLRAERRRVIRSRLFSETSYDESCAQQRAEDPVYAAQTHERQVLLEYAISTLKEREQAVLKMRYGFATGEPMSLSAVGKELGVCGVRIAQIEAKALRRMRHPSRAKRLREYGKTM